MIIRHARPFRASYITCWRSAGSARPPGPPCSPGGEPAELSGTYQGHAPAADAAKRVFTLNLAADGTASLTTLYIGKDDTTQHGRWTQSGSQVVMTFDAIGPNRPPPSHHFSSSGPRAQAHPLGS